ncbi:cysteine-rich PDZ-binding protein-like protein [Paraphysoderma sedebokerense]|nr:cysteine-rich PDZ-binding protein-like protein [Paraphysoderma sedebokerense]
MVCKKCEKKLAKTATSDVWKDGSRNATIGKDRKLNENKLLTKGKAAARFNPYSSKCKICKQTVHQQGSNYCQSCAYKEGICAMCGVKILDTSGYKMSSK